MPSRTYIGRFAPSPSGPLHAGSLATAMASLLDARAHGGHWLLRIEDLDQPRCSPAADTLIMQQLKVLGMHWDGTPVWQSQRRHLYEQALAQLRTLPACNIEGQSWARLYPCYCHRKDLPAGPYPGTCRALAGTEPDDTAPSWRLLVPHGTRVSFNDRWYGPQSQDVATSSGDIKVRRADGIWAYQLAVVVDDYAQGISHVVRGADLLESTPRQILLGQTLGYSRLHYLHVPLVLDATGAKLSKQNHAPMLDLNQPLACLQHAWQHLGFTAMRVTGLDQFWHQATLAWHQRFGHAWP